MSEEIENIELFERYLEDKLSETERADFENRLLLDSDFRDEYELYQMVTGGLKKLSNGKKLKDQLKHGDNQLAEKIKGSHNRAKRK